MQNRYVGDVGDFGKYALLRHLCKEMECSLGVNWYLFPNEGHNNDGRHISYLKRGHLSHLDIELHSVLDDIVEKSTRDIGAIESGLFFGRAVFFSEPVIGGEDFAPVQRRTYREAWHRRAFSALQECELIFLDPDNGFEIPSVPIEGPKAGKYVYYHEAKDYLTSKQSLIVYHHINRKAPLETQVSNLAALLADKYPKACKIIPLAYRRGSCRIFWLLLQPEHEDFIESVRRFLKNGWADHFTLLSDLSDHPPQ